jgi:hypothetical protein
MINITPLPQPTLDLIHKCEHIRRLIDSDDDMGNMRAAHHILSQSENPPQSLEVTPDVAHEILISYTDALLQADQFEAAATILWPRSFFDWRPESSRRVWESILKNDKTLVPGAGGLGKSYSGASIFYLLWRQDPKHTSIKVISVTKQHSKQNIFANFKAFHQNSVVSPIAEDLAEAIQVGPDQKNGIRLVAIPKGESGAGVLRGFHPSPRIGKPHPKFGQLSRNFVILDEAEEIPPGVWEGIDNLCSTMSPETKGHIKVYADTNPKDRTSAFGKRCEPKRGWGSIDLEDDHDWTSRDGYRVTRLDAKYSENVRERKIVYEGLQTYEGYTSYESKGQTPDYYCADDSTEVLTQSGWKKYDQVKVGDKIFTVNTTTGKAEWNETLEIFSKHFDGELISFESRHISALVTDNHRWAVTNKQTLSTKKPYRLKIKETKELAKHDLIPLCRDFDNIPDKISPDLAELAGWVVTDGTFSTNNRVVIYQSHTANKHKCDRISNLLNRLNVDVYEHKHGSMTHFSFSKDIGVWLKKNLPNKKLTMKFILSLGNEGRKRLLESIILGDGGLQGGGTRYACTKDKDQAELYSILMNLTGKASRIHERLSFETKFGKCDMYYVNELVTEYVRVQYAEPTPMAYKGIVWCPRTANGTWFARRKGTCYFTGNTFARGWFPTEGVSMQVIPHTVFENAVGIVNFIPPVTTLAGVDLALEGNDSVLLSHGRFGLADGWTPLGGQFIKFSSQRVVLQLDGQLTLPKGDTVKQTNELMRVCRQLRVNPSWLCVDRTGNGAGVHDNLKTLFGNVMGVNYSTNSTDTLVFREDTKKCNETYDGIVTELLFVLGRFMEFGFLKISPSFRNEELVRQATGRRYRQVKRGRVRVESKRDYCKRTNSKSPDALDSLSLLVHLFRMRSNPVVAMNDKTPKPNDPQWTPRKTIEGGLDGGFMDFSS